MRPVWYEGCGGRAFSAKRTANTKGLGLGIGLTLYRTPDVSFAGLSVRARVIGGEGDRAGAPVRSRSRWKTVNREVTDRSGFYY